MTPISEVGFTLSTWDAFAVLVEANGGIFGGCWCMGFHPEKTIAGVERLLSRRTGMQGVGRSLPRRRPG